MPKLNTMDRTKGRYFLLLLEQSWLMSQFINEEPKTTEEIKFVQEKHQDQVRFSCFLFIYVNYVFNYTKYALNVYVTA